MTPFFKKVSPVTSNQLRNSWRKIVRMSPLLMILGVTALIICLYAHYTSTTIDWTKTKEFFEALKNVAEIGAIISGGLWAYYRFFKGRTYKESLVPAVSGKFVAIGGGNYLVATLQLANVGLSYVKLTKEGTALTVFDYRPSASEKDIYSVSGQALSSFGVFESDEYLEPKEIIGEKRLIAIPGPIELAVRLDLDIRSEGGYTWRASTIVDKSSRSREELKPSHKGRSGRGRRWLKT